jgi:Histidinol-phosphate/aromatic aminotransferase and cobyric acid decarboxylase
MTQVAPVHHGGTADPAILDFSANTNPATPVGVRAVFSQSFDRCARYRTSHPAYTAAIADHCGCPQEWVLPTGGGIAALSTAITALTDPGAVVTIAGPTFGEYTRLVRVAGGLVRPVALMELAAADVSASDLVIICTPNNPCGRLIPVDRRDRLLEVAATEGVPVLVDEAFIDFTDAPSAAGHPAALVARSETKLFGLPGLRAGALIVPPRYSGRVAAVRDPWSIGTPAAEVAAFCLRQTEFIAATRRRVAIERGRMHTALTPAYEVSPSKAPFLLCHPRRPSMIGVDPADPVGGLCRRAAAAEIAIRDARSFDGYDEHIRVAVRRPHENDQLLSVLLGDSGE